MLPEERTDSEARMAIADLERRFVYLSLWMIPILFCAGWIAVGMFGRTILFLHPPIEIRIALTSRWGLAGGMFAGCLPILWWLSLRFSERRPNRIEGIRCALMVIATIIVGGLVVDHPKTRFTLEEAVKARAPQLDFVRNIAFKQQLLNSPAPSKKSEQPRIAIIGSSQINLGIDPAQLEDATGAGRVISACMPGMVPMQYLALARGLTQQNPSHVVCWVSEFDFFREDSIPTIRLRWCIDRENLTRIESTLTAEQKWRNRSELADLTLGCVSPLWQQRSLISLVAFRFWWAWDDGQTDVDADEAAVGGKLVGKERGVDNAKRNIRRTPMVDANFEAFAQFAKTITDAKIRLIVIEGESHPDTMNAYPLEFRTETRQRLQSMSEKVGFQYADYGQRPSFDESDWRDAVHLNANGRRRLTRYVASLIDKNSPDETRSEQ